MAKIINFKLSKAELDKINELAKEGKIKPVQLSERRPERYKPKHDLTFTRPQPPKKAA